MCTVHSTIRTTVPGSGTQGLSNIRGSVILEAFSILDTGTRLVLIHEWTCELHVYTYHTPRRTTYYMVGNTLCTCTCTGYTVYHSLSLVMYDVQFVMY